MTQFKCNNPDCTVSVTGKCLLSHSPIEACPHLQVGQAPEPVEPTAASPRTVVAHHGLELGPDQLSAILSVRYGQVVGLLGEYGTGKTCLLSSLYLLASCGELRPSFTFAGSQTLPGFENRLRRLRSWTDGSLPDQITDHTALADPRQPGFLHLAFRHEADGALISDMVFSDLPGEWTTNLIRRSDEAQKLQFLRRADTIVITFLARTLVAKESRNVQAQLGRVLLQRLRDSVGVDSTVPVIFAVTRCDETGTDRPSITFQMAEEATALGFESVSCVLVAAFSDKPGITSGLGVASLLNQIAGAKKSTVAASSARIERGRMFARFRASSEVKDHAS